jgi:hypothetical protein
MPPLCNREVSDQTHGLSETGPELLNHVRYLLHLAANPHERPRGG